MVHSRTAPNRPLTYAIVSIGKGLNTRTLHLDTFSAFFNSLQMLQLMSQTKDTFLMCRNYEQGHKRIRRASV